MEDRLLCRHLNRLLIDQRNAAAFHYSKMKGAEIELNALREQIAKREHEIQSAQRKKLLAAAAGRVFGPIGRTILGVLVATRYKLELNRLEAEIALAKQAKKRLRNARTRHNKEYLNYSNNIIQTKVDLQRNDCWRHE